MLDETAGADILEIRLWPGQAGTADRGSMEPGEPLRRLQGEA